MRCNPSLLLLSGCLLSVPLHAEDKPASPETGAASSKAFVIDLYVDTKTKQIYSEPGEGRVRMGSFEKVSDQKPAPGPAAGEALPSPGKAGEAITTAPAPAPKPQGMGYANWKSPDPFKWNLNPDGSQYLKFGFLNQVWLRHEENNPGSQVLGHPVTDTQDIGLRRPFCVAGSVDRPGIFLYPVRDE